MPGLREALSDALAARYTPGVRHDVEGMMAALEARLGGPKGSRAATARAIGIPRSSYDHWHRHGRVPSGPNRERLLSAYERHIRRPMIAARIDHLGLPRVIVISAVVVAHPDGTPDRQGGYRNKKRSGPSNATGYRDFRAGGLGRGTGLPRNEISAMVGAWLNGEDPVPHLLEAIRQCYQEPFDFEGDDVRVRFE